MKRCGSLTPLRQCGDRPAIAAAQRRSSGRKRYKNPVQRGCGLPAFPNFSPVTAVWLNVDLLDRECILHNIYIRESFIYMMKYFARLYRELLKNTANRGIYYEARIVATIACRI
jgi:hypothetical protein